jgi:serine/threonine protein kinase
VYQALDVRLQRPVALKLYRPQPSYDGRAERVAEHAAEHAERFAMEARILAGLSHPGLVCVYDYGVHDCSTAEQQPYLALELVPGTTLSARIAQGPLAPGAAARLGGLLASALTYVHGCGVVHRDVKPSNVMIGESPRLTDFGAAYAAGVTAGLTCTGEVIGTAAYLAPEQVRGRQAGPAADVHALGLVLIECLTGVREYPGAPIESAMARLGRPPRVPLGLLPGLGTALAWMTAPDPEDRPPASWCARQLAQAAEEYAGEVAEAERARSRGWAASDTPPVSTDRRRHRLLPAFPRRHAHAHAH